MDMEKSNHLKAMYPVRSCFAHGASPIPQEGKYDEVKEISQICGFSHSVGTCALKQGAAKLTVNVKDGIIQEALVETVGCSGMTHSAAMAAEILPGKTLLEALNTDLACDAINVAMREMCLMLCYGRSQTAFTDKGLPIGSGLEDLGKNICSQLGTSYGTVEKGPRYLQLSEGYIQKLALDKNNCIIGYQFTDVGEMMSLINEGLSPNEAFNKSNGTYGRFDEATTYINPRKE
jgi:NifU-like protein involved in Fe-S cluster formation